ncbi:MAG: 1-phosphofructokinase [Clostridiales bacterium]|nr:1-phosphofructokinase [Clostridiales bacterium]
MVLTVTLNVAIDKRYVVDDFKVNEVNRVLECDYQPGGKGINVSKAAKLAGASVTATGFIAGYAGGYVENELRKRDINCEFIKVPGESRSCINIFDTKHKTQTEFLEPGVTVTRDHELDLLEKFEALVRDHDIVTISGSAPAGTSDDIYSELIAIAKKHGKKVILDTSGQRLIDGIKAKPTLIKPNIDEIQMLAGRRINGQDDLIDIGKKIQANGIEFVVISLGKDGSVIIADEGIYRAIPPKIEAVNTVGCGDTMTAGFAIGLKKGLKLVDTIRLATAISAASAMRAETGYFKKEDMEELYDKVEILKL